MVTIDHEDGRVLDDAQDGVRTRRLMAWGIDAVIIGAIMGVGWIVIAMFGVVTFTLGWSLFPALVLVPFLYNFGFLASPAHASPGQVMMGIAMQRTDGLPPNGFQALLSTGVYAGTLALGFETRAIGLLLLLLPLFTPRKQTLHDMIAGLVAVRRGPQALTATTARWTMRGKAI